MMCIRDGEDSNIACAKLGRGTDMIVVTQITDTILYMVAVYIQWSDLMIQQVKLQR